MILLTVIVLAVLFFVYLSTKVNERRIEDDNFKREKILFICATIILIFFAGLRTEYNDTTAYMYSYIIVKGDFSEFSKIDWSIGKYPLFNCVLIVLKIFGATPQMFIFIFSAFTIGTLMWFIYKYSDNNILMSVFIFITIGFYTFNLAAIKQCTSIALCLIAINFLINKKPVRFFVFVIIAAFFHPYSILYLIVPFLRFVPWSRRSLLLLLAFLVAGFSLQGMFGTITDVSVNLGGEYSAESFKGEGVNVFRVAVSWVSVILSFFVKDKITENNDSNANMFINLSFLNAGFMFIGLFGDANYFARFANYFVVFQVLSIPYLINQFDEANGKTLKSLAVVGYSGFFIYANQFNEQFDLAYKSTSVLDLFR
ncbi:MAG: EpsG family protein [Ruminococcus sp.]|nr:EpsG family protein [Ruminococcus sp.]